MDMSGALYKNDRKEQPTHPDFTGKCTINGVEMWVSAWIKTYQKDGADRKYFSLSFKPKDGQSTKPQSPQPKPAAPVASGFDDMSDDIPW